MDWAGVLAALTHGKTVTDYESNASIFMQGASADSLLFILSGKVKLAVSSQEGKEAIVATLGPGEFFGEGCLAGQLMRMATATAVGDCRLARVDKAVMARRLHEEPGLAEMFKDREFSQAWEAGLDAPVMTPPMDDDLLETENPHPSTERSL